jgi:glycine/D-amino acid oxidase-like deaminating enzyme
MTRERVLIIGGGIAGASIGSELAADHDVILLEAEPSLGLHSTGRSAALFMVGYGPAPLRELTRRSEAEFTRLSELPDMPALLTPRGGLFTASAMTRKSRLPGGPMIGSRACPDRRWAHGSEGAARPSAG